MNLVGCDQMKESLSALSSGGCSRAATPRSRGSGCAGQRICMSRRSA